jgi:hypothetical protein
MTNSARGKKQGGTVCIFPAAECGYETHKGNKVEIKGRRVMVKKSETALYASPELNASILSNDLLEELLARTRTLEEFNGTFAQIRKLEPPVSLSDFRTRELDVETAFTFHTSPSAKKKRTDADEDEAYVFVEPFDTSGTKDIQERLGDVERYLKDTSSKAKASHGTVSKETSRRSRVGAPTMVRRFRTSWLESGNRNPSTSHTSSKGRPFGPQSKPSR